MSTQLVLFDYNSLDTETRIITMQRATEIKTLMRATAENIMQVGEKLLDVQVKLGNTSFDAWLLAEFDWSRRTAYNFIGVFKEFRGRANFAQMDIATSALYLLAAPSTPAEVREELLDRAEAGERLTHTEVKQAVVEAKAKQQPALPPTPAPALAPGEPAPWEAAPVVAPPPPPVVTKPVPVSEPDEDEAEPYGYEPEAEADEVESIAPPPPAPRPALPLPAPTVSAAPLVISLTVRAERALLTARLGDETLASEPLALDAVGRRVQAIIDRQFGKQVIDGETMPLWLQD